MCKKILIVSSSGDASTNLVMDWLSYLKSKPIRYNVDSFEEDVFPEIALEFGTNIDKVLINTKKEYFDKNESTSIWFRKYVSPDLLIKIFNSTELPADSENLIKYLNQEFFTANHALFETLQINTSHLGGAITKRPTKMDMLIVAKEVGLKIPNTLITNKKEYLKKFLKKEKNVITKSIRQGETFSKKGMNGKSIIASTFTEAIDNQYLENLPPTFFLSLFQESINKEIEIRTFYLDGNCYSMAIFSQGDSQTDVDFRMYNNEKSNRNIPYKLPSEIESKIFNLMKTLKLKTGSLDIILDKMGNYVFLEVNPWGQYGMVSDPCNYNLDQKIAEYLINN